jgi:hypothetical protein
MTRLPAPAEVWLARLDRAGGLTHPRSATCTHELLDVGDEAGQRRLWTQIGRRLGLDAPPDDLFEQGNEPELAAGPMPRRAEYRHEQR